MSESRYARERRDSLPAIVKRIDKSTRTTAPLTGVATIIDDPDVPGTPIAIGGTGDDAPISVPSNLATTTGFDRDPVTGQDLAWIDLSFTPIPAPASEVGAPTTSRPAYYRISYSLDAGSTYSPESTLQHQSATITTRISRLPTNAPTTLRVRAESRSGGLGAYVTTTTTTSRDFTGPAQPSTPIASGSVQSIRIVWDGLTSGGQAQPLDFQRCDIHVSTTNNFAPTAATKAGQFGVNGGTFAFESALTTATTYYTKLISYDLSGNASAAESVQASATTVIALTAATGVSSIAVVNNASVNQSVGAVTITNSLTPTFTSVNATTLGVSGASTLASLSATSGTFNTTLGVTGVATLSSTLNVSGQANLNALTATTGLFTGALTVRNGSDGHTKIQSGGAGNSGYLEFHPPSGSRQGYIGYSATTAAMDAGTIPYVAGTHAFSGALTISSTLGVSGASTVAALTASGLIRANGSLDLNNASSDGNRYIYTYSASDLNWRIGMGSPNVTTAGSGASFTRLYATTHVQYITYAAGATQGFAVGPGGGTSHLEVRGSDGLFFVRNSMVVGGNSSLQTMTATTGSFSSTLGVTGATTLSATLGVTGASTLASLSATSGSFSTTLGVTGAATLSATLLVAGTITTDAGGQALTIRPGATADHVYMGWNARSAAPTQRSAYAGFDSAAGTTFTLANELVNGNINLATNGTGSVLINGGRAYYRGIGRANGVIEGDISYDTIMGAAGAGVGSLGMQAVFAYNIKDGAITADKLSLPAVASVIASGAGNNTSNSFFRFAYLGDSYIDPVTGSQLSGLTLQNGATVITDAQAYQNYAVSMPSGQPGVPGVNGPTSLTLPAGIYTITVYCRVTSNSSATNAITVGTSTATGTAPVSGSPVYLATALSTVGYMGCQLSITVGAGGATGVQFQVYNAGGGGVAFVSHITGIPAAAVVTPKVATVFSPNIFATSATISSVSATSLVSGTIQSDDIYLGVSGRIYAGQGKLAGRVELNGAGLYAFSTRNLLPDPSLESGGPGPVGSLTNATFSNVGTTPYHGTRSGQVTATAAGNTNTQFDAQRAGAVQTAVAGVSYATGVWVRATTVSRNFQVTLRFINSANNAVLSSAAGSLVASSTTGYSYVWATGVAPVGTGYIDFGITGFSHAAGETFLIDAGQIEQGTSFTQFTTNINPLKTTFQLTNNGRFLLASEQTTQRMELDTTGLRFYDAAGTTALTVNLDATTGSFTLQSGATNASVMRLTNSALEFYNASSVKTVELLNTGSFTLQSSAGVASTLRLTNTSLALFNASSIQTVGLVSDGTFFLRSATTGARIDLTGTGLRGYNSAGTLVTDLQSASGTLSLTQGTPGGNRLAISSAGMELYAGATRTLFADAATGNVTMTGTVTASAGAIGGWDIAATTLSSGGVNAANSITLNTASGYIVAFGSATNNWVAMYRGNSPDGLSSSGGAASSQKIFRAVTAGVDNFSISATGGVYMSGTVTASAGAIGGWDIATNSLSSGGANTANSITLNTSSGYIVAYGSDWNNWVAMYRGNSPDGLSSSGGAASSQKIFRAVTAGVDNFSISATGGVYMSGEVRASSGLIGGFTLGATELSSGLNATRVQMSSAAAGGFWAGATLRDSAPFRVTQAGTMFAGGTFTLASSLTGTGNRMVIDQAGLVRIAVAGNNYVETPHAPVQYFSTATTPSNDSTHIFSGDHAIKVAGYTGGDAYALVRVSNNGYAWNHGSNPGSVYVYADSDTYVNNVGIQGSGANYATGIVFLPGKRWTRLKFYGTGTLDHFVIRPNCNSGGTQTGDTSLWYSGFQLEAGAEVTPYMDRYQPGVKYQAPSGGGGQTGWWTRPNETEVFRLDDNGGFITGNWNGGSIEGTNITGSVISGTTVIGAGLYTATTGRRVEIGPNNGQDIRFFTEFMSQNGYLDTYTDGGGLTARGVISLSSPAPTGEPSAYLRLYSEHQANGQAREFMWVADTTTATTTTMNVSGDVFSRGERIPHGLLALQTLTANTAAIAGLTIISSVSATHTRACTMKLTFSWRSIEGTVAGDVFQLIIAIPNVVQFGELNIRIPVANVGAEGGTMTAIIGHGASGTYTYEVGLQRVAGTGTAFIQRSSDAPSYLIAEELG